MRRMFAAAGTLMHTTLVLRAVPRAEAAARGRAARHLSAVRVGSHSPPFRSAAAESPARQSVAARASITSLESYSAAPPLEVVPWTKEASNTVTLTGTVGSVDVRRLSTGKTKASIRLAVRNKAPPGEAEPDTDWFDVEVWNELAEQVAEHAPKGSKLVVSGKLTQDKWTDKETGKARSMVRVVAFKVAAVEPYRGDAMGEASTNAAPMRASFSKPAAAAARSAAPSAPPSAAPAKSTTGMSTDEREAHFLDLLYYPQNWYDNRPQPADSRRPDFKHKSTDLALWLEDANRPSRLPAYVADYMGHRGQVPPPTWTPPSDDGMARPASDASASPF